MNRLKPKAPSPSMVIALIALFVALSGIAVAGVTLSNNTVRSNNIVNGQVKNADLATNSVGKAKIRTGAIDSARIVDGSVADVDIAGLAGSKVAGTVSAATNAVNAASAANADKLDNLDSTDLKPRWAVVNANGSLARGSAGVTSQYSGASFYTVSFPVNVTGCAYTATIGGTSTSYAGFGEISVYSANALPNSVTVVTHNAAGTLTDKPFHIMVVC